MSAEGVLGSLRSSFGELLAVGVLVLTVELEYCSRGMVGATGGVGDHIISARALV